MTFVKTLSRDEMKNVTAGNGTNCIICPDEQWCTSYMPGKIVPEGCSWGECLCDDPQVN